MKETHPTKGPAYYAVKKKRLILTFFLAFIAFFVFIPLITYYYFAPDLVSKEAIMNRNDSGVTLLDRNGKPFFTFNQAKFKEFTPISEISPNIQNAVVAIEDKDFYTHPGFSVKAIVRAFIANLQNKEISQGGSTLTQQLVKNSILTPKRSMARKFQEALIALEIERKYTKKEILEMYLNSVYFGDGAFGVEEGAQIYFGKHAKDLDVAEAAMLAGVLPSPSKYSPISGDSKLARERQLLVLQDMYNQKYVTKDQLYTAQSEKLTFNGVKSQVNALAPHFALMVLDQLKQNYGEEEITRSGYKVKTTIDSDMQKYAEQSVANHVTELNRNNAHNGAAVVIDPKTGEILALVGSANWYDDKYGKVNMATTPRQPGSSFKPIVYSDAMDKTLITPATILNDTPHTFPGGYKPLDYDLKSRGPVTVRRALSNSLNIPAVEVMEKVGVPDVLDWAKHLGITTLGDDPSNYGLSLVLGTGEVPLVQMTSVYATFANRGYRNEPVSILEIQDKQNKTIYSYTPNPQSVLDPRVAFLISSILSDNNARAETFNNLLNISRPAAVKTGTTENYKNALTLGYTPSLAVGVWVGNNDQVSMDNVAGSLGPAPIWKDLMEHFLAGTPVEQFEVPDGVVKARICTVVTPAKDSKDDKDKEKDKKPQITYATEYFIEGTEKNTCGIESLSPTETPSTTPSPSVSPSPTPTGTPSPTLTPSPTPTRTPSPTSTPQSPSATPAITISPPH